MSREVKKKITRKKSTARKEPTRVTLKNQKKRAPSVVKVRERAYEIFVSRGCEHGNHTDDWLRAEQELRN